MANENEGTEEVDGEVTIKDPKAVLAALQRAKDDAKKYHDLADAKDVENKSLSEKIVSLEGDEGVALWKKRAIEVSARAALSTAGVKDPERVLGFMNVESVTMDESGKLSGFDESVAEVKSKLPELFDAKRRVGGQADIHEQGDIKQQKSTTEMQVDKLFTR